MIRVLEGTESLNGFKIKELVMCDKKLKIEVTFEFVSCLSRVYEDRRGVKGDNHCRV